MSDPQPYPPLTPQDFYLEDGRLVFTADYHRRRGFCCGSGCRHCPWRSPSAESAPPAPEPSPSANPLAAPPRRT